MVNEMLLCFITPNDVNTSGVQSLGLNFLFGINTTYKLNLNFMNQLNGSLNLRHKK